jgi:hypothetical protein
MYKWLVEKPPSHQFFSLGHALSVTQLVFNSEHVRQQQPPP